MKETENSVDEYLSQFSGDVRNALDELRDAIRKAAPGADEVMSYQMPAYKQNGILVYFAAHKNHIGFYPTASAMIAFADELNEYKTSKGTLQFPFGQPLPLKLIEKIVKFRVKENLNKLKKS